MSEDRIPVPPKSEELVEYNTIPSRVRRLETAIESLTKTLSAHLMEYHPIKVSGWNLKDGVVVPPATADLEDVLETLADLYSVAIDARAALLWPQTIIDKGALVSLLTERLSAASVIITKHKKP